MKKTISLIAVIIICLNSFAQTKDSIPKPQLSDTSKFISVRDVNTAVEGIKDKITAKQYEDWSVIWNYVIQTLSKEYEDKHSKK